MELDGQKQFAFWEKRSQKLVSHKSWAVSNLWNRLKEEHWASDIRKRHSIGDYVVDFCCPSKKLVIELEKNNYSNFADTIRQMEKTACLEQWGFKVVRLKAKAVYDELGEALKEIRELIKERSNA
jgi:very-short-patch-repair endonuclease